MGSLMTSESQDTRLTSLLKDSTLHRAVSPITAMGNWEFFTFIFLDQRKECLLLALQHHFQQHLVSHLGTDQDQPCIASEVSQQWDAGLYAAGSILCFIEMWLHKDMDNIQLAGFSVHQQDRTATS